MPNEDQSALEAQGFGNYDKQDIGSGLNGAMTPGDLAFLAARKARNAPDAGSEPKLWGLMNSGYTQMNPNGKWVGDGKDAPPVWQAPDDSSMKWQGDDKFKSLWEGSHSDVNAPNGISLTDPYKKLMGQMPDTVFGKFNGSKESAAMGKGDFAVLGGSKSQGPNWDNIPSQMKVKDKKLVAWDDNYGWITPQSNYYDKEAETDQKQIAAMKAAAGLAFGGITGPGAALGTGLVNAGASLGNGANWKQALLNFAPSLIGAGMSAGGFNISPEIAKYLQYAKMGYGAYNGVKNRDPFVLAQLAAQGYKGMGR